MGVQLFAPRGSGNQLIKLPTSLRKTVRWFLENRNWWEAIRQGRYGGERLGLKQTSAGSA